MLTKIEHLFLQAVRASVRDERIMWRGGVSAGEWQELFALALRHKLFPMVLESVYRCMAFCSLKQPERKLYQKQSAVQVLMQTISTQEYGNLLHYLERAGLHPITVKGVVCRQLYPQPELRISADEDMLIRAEELQMYHRELLEYGMYPEYTGTIWQKEQFAEEISYRSRNSSLRVEVHTVLFPGKNTVFASWNQYFEQVWQQEQQVMTGSFPVRTIDVTDHLFYLICHMLKHFMHSGFGIRQICDLMLFAEAYGEKIQWEKIVRQCQEIQGVLFVSALFGIADRYLQMNTKKACIPEALLNCGIDTEPLLRDILSAGVYGSSDKSRVHSSSVTLRAVTQKQNERKWREWLRLLFPSADMLKQRYPVLQTHSLLLPFVWIMRMLHYRKESLCAGDRPAQMAVKAVKTGKQRVELLKEYGIL